MNEPIVMADRLCIIPFLERGSRGLFSRLVRVKGIIILHM
jgi:hypothetical protein